MSSPSKRRDMDVMKLMMSDFEVSLGEGASPNDFYVKFHGPKQSPYEGGIWKIHVTLPVNYPYSSPSIGFTNHIYHPNVDFASGSVCLDVINQTWSPMYNLVNVFSTFLPQLLLYPNPADPLNGEAASVMNRNKDEYNKKVIELVKKYASADIKVKMDDDEEAATTTTGAARASTVPTAKKPTVSSSSSSSSSSTPPSSASDTKEKEEPEEEEEELSDLDDEPAGTMEDM